MAKRESRESSESIVDNTTPVEAPPVVPAYVPAPTREEALAYWASGRLPEEAHRLMEEFMTACAKTGAKVYYFPERGEDGQLKPAPTNLIAR